MNENVQPVAWWPIWQFQVANPICDMCNVELDEFPAAVVSGRALCKKCRGKWHIKWGDEEYFESPRYVIGDEPPNPGVNFGGRKRR